MWATMMPGAHPSPAQPLLFKEQRHKVHPASAAQHVERPAAYMHKELRVKHVCWALACV